MVLLLLGEAHFETDRLYPCSDRPTPPQLSLLLLSLLLLRFLDQLLLLLDLLFIGRYPRRKSCLFDLIHLDEA